jgi:hypothetical protein
MLIMGYSLLDSHVRTVCLLSVASALGALQRMPIAGRYSRAAVALAPADAAEATMGSMLTSEMAMRMNDI